MFQGMETMFYMRQSDDNRWIIIMHGKLKLYKVKVIKLVIVMTRRARVSEVHPRYDRNDLRVCDLKQWIIEIRYSH